MVVECMFFNGDFFPDVKEAGRRLGRRKLLRGGAAEEETVSVATVNVTSMMRNWAALRGLQESVIGVTETRATKMEQTILQARLQEMGMTAIWGTPLSETTHGMKGRSGGVALLVTAPMESACQSWRHCQ